MSDHDSFHPRVPGEDIRPQGQTAPSALYDHERKDVSLAGILWFAAILALVIVVVQIMLAFWVGQYSKGEDRAAQAAPPRLADTADLYPGPRIQGDPTADMQVFAAHEAKALTSYGQWRPLSPDDPASARVVRLPINRAIDILAQKAQGNVPPAAKPAPKTPQPAPSPAVEAKAKPE